MNKRVYKLKDDLKYEVPKGSKSPCVEFAKLITYRKFQIELAAREERIKKYKRPSSLSVLLALVVFHYLFIGLVMLLSKLGF